MPPRKNERARRRRKNLIKALLVLNLVLIVAVVAVASAVVVKLIGGGKITTAPSDSKHPTKEPMTTTATTVAGPRAPKVIATATVGNSGDILIHSPVLKAAKVSSGVYNFDSMFQHLTPYVSKLDYAAINMEFGFGKGESDYHQREMIFRVPTSLADTVMKTGYDLGLCANNHVNNGNSLSFTASVYNEKNMDHIGLRASSSEKRYLVKDVSGIKLGFVNYTYGSQTSKTGMVNYFSTDHLPTFYADMEEQIAAMKADGAEAIVVYIHWGNEYQIKPNSHQTSMAKKLCEMGVDVIVGGHPHKIQPVELITAENGNQTVCLYSMGNILSNQTIESMYGGSRAANKGGHFQDYGQCPYPDVKTRYSDTHYGEHHENCNDNGHTEDGLLFNYTFTKYEDGTVMLTGVDVLPTWCYMTGSGDSRDYKIIPLDKSCEGQWATKFGIAAEDVIFAQRSYDRTMAILGEGIQQINDNCKAKVSAYVEAFKNAQKTE